MYPMPLGYHRYTSGTWGRYSSRGVKSQVKFKHGLVTKTVDGILRFEDHRDLGELCRMIKGSALRFKFRKDKKNLTLWIDPYQNTLDAKYQKYFPEPRKAT